MEDREKIQNLKGGLFGLTNQQLRDLKKSLNIKKGGKNKSDLVDAIISSVEEYEVRLDKVEEKFSRLAEQSKKGGKSAKEKKLTKEDLSLFKENINSELQSLKRDIRKVSQEVEETKKLMTEYINLLSYLENSVKVYYNQEELNNILQNFRKVNSRIESINDLNMFMRKLNLAEVNPNDIIKLGNLIAASNSLSNLDRESESKNSLESFYNMVKSQSKKFKSEDGSIPIYKVREILVKKTELTEEEFDKKLGDSFRKGWLTLDFRSPIGEKDIGYATIEGKDYYIIRKFNK